MNHAPKPAWHQFVPAPLMLQGIIAAAVLAIALSPAKGGAALYLPLIGGETGGTVRWSRAHGADLLASGPYDGAMFLRVPDGSLGLAAIRRGALLIAVPESLCGGAPPATADRPQTAGSPSMAQSPSMESSS